MRTNYTKHDPIIIFSVSLFIFLLVVLSSLSSLLYKSGIFYFFNPNEIYNNLNDFLLNLSPKISIAQSNNIKNIDHAPNAYNLSNDIKVERNPIAVAVNELLNKVYVTNYGDNSISVIDEETNRVINNIIVDGPPSGVAVNPVTNLTYVSINNDPSASTTINGSIPLKKNDTILVIDGHTDHIVSEITVEEPTGIAVNSVTNMIYVEYF